MKFKTGDLVSVWFRKDRRHKWRMESGHVSLLRVDDKGALVQTAPNETHEFGFRGVGKWKRKLRKAVRC